MERSKKNLSFSIQMHFLHNLDAIIPVVPDPEKGSSMVSPVLVDAKIILLRSSSGFCVGCFQ
jgi:hypothetical protein